MSTPPSSLPLPRSLARRAGGAAASPAEEVYCGWFTFLAFWAFVSATVIATMLYEQRSRWAAWFWAVSLVVTSLAAAHFLWRLL